MTLKRPIRDLERQLKREPDNLALRLTLAAGYRESGRAVEALALYRSVALAYAEQGRATQATAVCRSALELAPEDGELFSLLRHLERTTTMPPPFAPTPAAPLAPPPDTAPAAPPPAPRPPTVEPPLRPAAPRLHPPPIASAPPPTVTTTRGDNPMLATVKRVPPPPRPAPAPLRPLPNIRASSSELDTPLPPPLPLHDAARDSVVEMPSSALIADDSNDSGETVIPLTHVRGERPSIADFAAEMVTRRRPKLSSRDLELLDLAPGDSAVTDPRPRLGGRQVEVETEAETAILDDDEPTTPPGRHPTDDFADRGATFERSFDETLAQLDPAGLTLEGPLGVFAILPPEAGAELARRAVVKPYDPGEVVIREGDLGDACYVIVRGEVVVQKRGPEGVDVELARLGEGALFGEFALLADRRRHATVVAAVDSEIYEIPRHLLRELAAAFPAVGPALEGFYRERLLSNLLLTTPLFALVPAEQRPALLARFQPQRVESGAAVVRQGERAGGLFLIVLGAVEVIRDLGLRTATVLASLGEGAYFGEMSLLSGDVASASVIAVGPCELAVLPPRDFYDVVSGNPALWTAMRGEAEARRLANAQILAGRTGVV
ncbi:MAG: cyclic nucleotide-binding domain-containing protein [Myxococcales bacterium]|nr:cyclic nucleotide-binding domain-containing protein [Myxococcales bacterium]MBK7198648.1 cyclic nucleotide-binding domain-containing protein [Myxococcales bacterium]MBP6846169.1 cyclic nucleotide-binding domain-containing protein [Kofleriaceae bacterium]